MSSDYEADLLRTARTAANSADRRSAFVKLRDMRSEAARSVFIDTILHERSNQNLRETAIKALGEVGLPEDLELLRRIADGETDEPAKFARDAAAKAHMRLAARLRTGSTIAGKRQLRSPIPARVRYQVLARDNNTCVSCGRSQHDGAVLQADHIVPQANGGSNDPENLQTLCDLCNVGKSNRDDRDLRRRK